MHYLDKLKALKESRHLTNADIAELSGVPLTTVNRIFSGQTPNPLFDNVANIVIALGGSLDDIVGVNADSRQETQNPDITDRFIESNDDLIKEKDNRIQELTATVKRLRRQNTRILFFIGIFVSIVVLALLFDMLNGHFGYIRYNL